MKAFVSWSGGKETSLACYKAMQDHIKVIYLLNMISEDGRRSRSHGLSSALLRAQADAMGIPIIQRKTTWKSYERVFKRAVLELRKEDIEIGVFGDINLQEHRDWVERVCREIEIKPLLPLWEKDREKLLKEFIRAGFEALVVATKADLLGKEWLGRKIDEEFIKDLKRLGNISPVRNKSPEATASTLSGISNGVDLCGEKGEYHTFVTDGPLFKRRVKILKSKKIQRNGHWFLEILKWRLKEQRF